MRLAMNMWLVIAAWVVCGLAAPMAWGQDTVSLRSVVRLGADESLVLSKVAVLDGPLVAGIKDTALELPDAGESGWHRLEVSDVRAALVEALGERGAMVLVRGGPCDIRRRSATPSVTHAPPVQADTPEALPDASALVGLGTVRGHLARRVATMLNAEASDLRLSFAERDMALLDTLGVGRVIDVKPMGSGARIPFAVKVFEGDRLIVSGTIRVGVERRTTVAVVAKPISRGQTIVASDLNDDVQWLAPDVPTLSAAETIGRVARGPMQPGMRVEASRVEQAVIVRRGDLVNVDVVAGSVVVTVECRARGAGTMGEIIEFEFKDDRSRTLQARIQGRGRAVTTTGSSVAPTVPAIADVKTPGADRFLPMSRPARSYPLETRR